MINLLRLRGKRHEPDIEALSAHLDGQLDAGRSAALEAHLTACEACQASLDGLRETRSLLRRMPLAEAPRSFRLRPGDVAVRTPARRQAPSLVRWSPVAAGAAFAVFAVVLGADLYTRDGDGSPLASREMEQRTGAIMQDETFAEEGAKDSAGGAAGAEGPTGEIELPDTGTSVAAAAPPSTASTEAPLVAAPTPNVTVAPPGPATATDTLVEAAPETGAATPESGTDPSRPDTEAAPPGPPPDGDVKAPAPGAPLPSDDGSAATEVSADAAARAPAGSTPTPELSALASDDETGGGGNRTGLLIVEIAAATAAIVSGGTFIAWRLRRKEEP